MTEDDIIKTLENAKDAPSDPVKLFMQWLKEAEKTEPSDANAMCLSTLGADGRVGSRIILLKNISARGFVFYTNTQSRKAQDLAANPIAALNFHWKSLGRQVRIEGNAEQISPREADAYFATRPRGSRIGAWASDQSRPLESRSALRQKVIAIEENFAGIENISRPPHWGGYMLVPDMIEFWHEGAFRLHSRLAYKRRGGGWDREMLFP